MIQADYIIVGQGLAGTLLSRRLLSAGCSVIVVDDGSSQAASRNAGGIINPVTGKRLVRSWMIEELLPAAMAEYQAIGQGLGISIIAACELLDFHVTADMSALFAERCATEGGYLYSHTDEERWKDYFRFNYGIGGIGKCMLVDLCTLLDKWRAQLSKLGCIMEDRFDRAQLTVDDSGVRYGSIDARSIIFCDGATSAENPYFERLPWSKDKGEALIVSIPGLPRGAIYKQGITIVPWRDGLFWVGASHDWKYTTTGPTASFRSSVEERLDYWLRLPYEVVGHIAALRPANLDRKPFIGMHPAHSRVGIFNGMGGKGCSLAPYFAAHFCDHLVRGAALMPDVDVQRYRRVLLH